MPSTCDASTDRDLRDRLFASHITLPNARCQAQIVVDDDSRGQISSHNNQVFMKFDLRDGNLAADGFD